MWSKFSLLDKFKFLMVIIAAFGGGALIMIGPDGMAEEITYHREIGMGFIGFGVLALLALVSIRAKALVIAMGVGLFSIAALWAGFYGSFGTAYSVLIGVLGAGGLLFFGQCVLSVVTGQDPSK